MNLKETDLPGIGRKYCLHTASGEMLVAVVHNDERRELFHLDKQENTVLSMVTMNDEEARMIASILGGIAYKPQYLETQEVLLDDLLIEWVRMEPNSPCIGLTIGELDIRGTTGASVLAAVEKNRNKVINPGPDYRLAADSTLIVAAERVQLKELKRLLHQGSD